MPVRLVPVTVTALLEPTPLVANAPVPLDRVTVSPLITPFNAPPLSVAVSVPSYTRLAAVWPATVSGLAAIVAFAGGWSVSV